MKRSQWILPIFAAAVSVAAGAAPSGFREFITAKGGELYEGEKPFRFISFNIPNLTYTEDDMQFEHLLNFRLPTAYEADDALATIQQMGGRVARSYVLSIRKPSDPPSLPRHILKPDQLDEQAMMVLDRLFETANRRGVRLIIPFIDHNNWWGGIEEFAGFRGKSKNDFFTDPGVKSDYKTLVQLVLNRVNTRTGVRYMDDKAVLAWELGNELVAPKEWVSEMASYIKQLDPKHLVAESYFTAPDNAGVDIVQDHLYQGDPVKMIDQIRSSYQRAAGRKVYMVGEFGFITTEGMRAIIDTIIHEPAISGGLIWSLRFHNQDGGYYWHHEPYGGDFFKAYHWPGGPAGAPYDETRFMKMVREKAYEIQGRATPGLDVPAAPELISVTDGGLVNWRGSTGASSYDLQRAEKRRSQWRTIGYQLTDDAVQYRALAVDEFATPGRTYYYRLLSRNEAGLSKPSNEVGPVTIRCRTVVDELSNLSHTYRKGGKLEMKSNDARNYKEDCHRVLGGAGAWMVYHVTGRITGARVYAFGEQNEAGLSFRAGCEGGKGETIPAEKRDFYAGKDMYNFRPPRLYTLGALPGNSANLLIQFENETQIGRVEIEYQ
jgi:mannan endo-1,4-beta-mannosidase